jgi:hypothetical protein
MNTSSVYGTYFEKEFIDTGNRKAMECDSERVPIEIFLTTGLPLNLTCYIHTPTFVSESSSGQHKFDPPHQNANRRSFDSLVNDFLPTQTTRLHISRNNKQAIQLLHCRQWLFICKITVNS